MSNVALDMRDADFAYIQKVSSVLAATGIGLLKLASASDRAATASTGPCLVLCFRGPNWEPFTGTAATAEQAMEHVLTKIRQEDSLKKQTIKMQLDELEKRLVRHHQQPFVAD